MSDDWGFAPPPFKPDEALLRLKRDLREVGLTEREGVFERRASKIVRVVVDGAVIQVHTVKRPSRTSPEWLARSLSSGADVRDFMTELKKKLAAWSDIDD